MNNQHATIAIAVLATAANADVLDMKFTGTGAGKSVQIQLGDADAQNLFAGELNHQITNATGVDAYLNGMHRTFCADITEHVAGNYTQYQTTALENIPLTANNPTPMTTVQANAIRTLYIQTAPTLIAGNLSNELAAAMQITVWEIVNDFDGTADSFNLNDGNLIISGQGGDELNHQILAHVDSLKDTIMDGINLGEISTENVIGLANEGAQDQLLAVPAPGVIALMAAGGLIATRRRRG